VNPHSYIDANVAGFMNILEGCRHHKIKHLVYASSSSVYGLNEKYPFSVHDNVDHPISLYAAPRRPTSSWPTLTVISTAHRPQAEVLHCYGPWGGRTWPFFFSPRHSGRQTIDVFNHGKMKRDFTYIDDIVTGVVKSWTEPERGSQVEREETLIPRDRTHPTESTTSGTIRRWS